jgi:hypothetical protein
MDNPTLAYTSSGVEQVVILDRADLDALALWLCADDCYHDKLEHWADRSCSDDDFMAQQKVNGGYCNVCRDHAGAILAIFNVKPRVTA